MSKPVSVPASASSATSPSERQTTVGNYFVSNYPPYAFWKTEHVGELEAALQRAPQPDTPLGLYVHIPFCRKRCHFCYYKVYTDKNAAQIRGYLDAVLDELSRYAAQPFVGGRKPRFIYFGGGTPSYLSVDQLRYLTERMKALLPWDEAEEVTFEAEPGTLTDHKLEAIRQLGVTRLSLGVEHFDAEILAVNGRAHRGEEIYRAYRHARHCAFPQINIDLIAGMMNDTDAKWEACIEQTLELAPDSVTIYEMEIPYNTTIYQRMKAEGKAVAPVADWDTKRRWVSQAFAALEQHGYTVTSAYTAVKDPRRTRFVYRDRLWSGADLLAVGVASFGHIGGTHYQNLHDFEPYEKALQQGRLPIYRALTPSPLERLIREFILQLKLGRVRRSYFIQKFGADPCDPLAEPLQRLQEWGYLSVQGDWIHLNRDGLLQVDRLLREFFLPEHRTGRYA